MISKTIAFLLAVALFAAMAVKTVAFLYKAEENNWGLQSYVEMMLRSKTSDFTQMSIYQRLYRNYVDDVLRGALTLGDGSKQAYETYQKNNAAEQKAFRDRHVQTVLQNCLGKSGRGSPAAIGWYLFNGYVTLRKLANHQKHFVNGRIEVTGGWYQYYSDSGEEGYDMDFDFNRNGESPLTTTMADEGFGTDDIQSSFEIPEDVQNRLRDSEYAVELCHTKLSTSRHEAQELDGYYALTLNENAIVTDFSAGDETPLLYSEFYEDYEAFLSAYDNYIRTLNNMENLKIAVVDNETKQVVSNVRQFAGKTFSDKAKTYFEKFDWHAKCNYQTGSTVYSDAYQTSMNGGDFGLMMLDCVSVIDRANVTLYVALADKIVGDDPVAALLNERAAIAGPMDEMKWVWLVGFGGIVLCVIYLIIRSGRKHGDDDLHMMRADKIFTLLRTAINFGLCVLLGWAFVTLVIEMMENDITGWPLYALLAACAAAAMALLIDWLLYIARHIKERTLFKNLFLVWLILKLRVWYKKRKEQKREKEKPSVEYCDIHQDVKRRVLLLGFLPNLVLGVLAVIFMACEVWALAIILLILIFGYNVFLALYVIRYAYRVRAGIEAVHRIRGGDYDVHLHVDDQSPAIASFARDVNSINDGLRVAVSNAIKDERMRAELITNVSHDLKTPLTSIINYVDLLSHCDIEDETAQSYLTVLSEKSERLKKLIEDLVEASKASSGAMRVDLVDMSLEELANQIAGEYEDAFAQKQLQLIMESEGDVTVRADGKLSYRVLDNLMSNVKKYAMPGTRVYLSLTQTDTHGVLTLRNISENQLNIPVEELMERFVRADASRSTEGSGLGLSIADNLCTLQNAKLTLSISGDLFTAQVAFPKA